MNSVVVLLVAGIAAALAPSAAHAFQQAACNGAPNPGWIFSPSPVSCDQYVRCFNGAVSIDHCERGFHFNAPGQNCRAIGQVDCTRCGPIGHVNLPDPNNCRAFIECQFGVRTPRVCGAGLLFDRRVGACNREQLVNCGGNGGGGGGGGGVPTPVCPANVHVNKPHWNDCSRFFECFFGDRRERQCPTNFLFDTVSRQCVRANLATCNGGGGGGGGGGGNTPQCPPTGTAALPHPTDCTRFFRCSNGISFAEQCPSTSPHFNERRLVCDSVQNAQCRRG